ncbi:MAG: hypothetical protein KAR20_07105 [Candidatus Heimdallarchaeota archaeon]|nr:hypothetical protein [Candidatus Heimdallarchaeota archaeon]
MDTRLVIVFLFDLGPLTHTWMHTVLLGTLLGFVIGIGVHFTQQIWQPLLKIIRWEQKTPLWSKILVAVLMVYLHLFLDAMLYPEMNPFWPILGNPFLNWLSSSTVYSMCSYGFVLGFLEYLAYLLWSHFYSPANSDEIAKNLINN